MSIYIILLYGIDSEQQPDYPESTVMSREDLNFKYYLSEKRIKWYNFEFFYEKKSDIN